LGFETIVEVEFGELMDFIFVHVNVVIHEVLEVPFVVEIEDDVVLNVVFKVGKIHERLSFHVRDLFEVFLES
jgi:hypothetical protein